MARRFERVYPSIMYLARECGIAVRTAKLALAQLRACGLVATRKHGWGSTLSYRLLKVARSAFERLVANSAAFALRFTNPNLSGGFKSFGEREHLGLAAKKRLLREQARMLLAEATA